MIQRLRQALSQRRKQYIADNDNRYELSAVLIPIYYKNGEYYILVTKRTDRVKAHKGQISFPGGTYEARDRRLVDTALRECAEEIGLTPDKVEILGELDDTVTETSNYIISPFVGLIPYPYQFRINAEEIEEIIEIPVSALLDKDRLHLENKVKDGKAFTSYSYHYQGRVIWGATARILNQFLHILVQAMEDSQRDKCQATD